LVPWYVIIQGRRRWEVINQSYSVASEGFD
jgi:hypothetical protein